jgi:DNA mismatch repair ATPase MutS
MAGMPASLIQRANEILKQLEEKQVDDGASNLEDKRKAISVPQNATLHL